MRKLLTLSGALLLMICANGCATKTVVIDSRADVVRLGKGVRGPVYIWDKARGAWVLYGAVTLPEGWFASPGPSDLSP